MKHSWLIVCKKKKRKPRNRFARSSSRNTRQKINPKPDPRMHRRLSIAVVLALLSAVITASAHDLFLKLDSYFLKPNSTASVRLLNGTFAASDGVVSRERFRAISLHGPSGQGKLDPTIK